MKTAEPVFQGFDQLFERFGRLRGELEALSVTGESGTGMVRVTVNGRREVARVQIDPALLREQDLPLLEDLVAAAVNDAARRLERELRDRIGRLAGMPTPGAGL